ADLASALESLVAPGPVTLAPVAPHPLFAGVGTLSAASDLPASRWVAAGREREPLLTLARRGDDGAAAVWVEPAGRGRIVISAYASLLGNGRLGEAGNARWLSNLLADALGPGGRVLIDDAHQGAGDGYDARAFFADPRLHRTLAWLVAVWLVLVVGTQALRPAPAGPAPRDDTAWLATTAGYFANALAPALAGRRLLEHFANGLRRRLALPEDGVPPWDWLEADARIAPSELERLRAFDARLAAGRRVDVAALDRLLSELTRRLA
ncbi:MAG: hypothetical protein JSR54_20295, partial [Proteobacteria bacterium]|nr:hypothetical protein [Pseudomonadota bacterium]